MLIRRASPSDAEGLAILAERTFRKTFEDGNTQEDMELHCQASYSTEIQLKEILRQDWITLVCEYESKLIGYAQLRWEEFPPCVNSIHAGEILCLYVDEPYHGKGFAQALIRKCFTEFEAKGSDVVWLGVWEHNPRAISFYRKLGFTEVGEHIFQVGSDPQRDIIMKRSTYAS
ncbi:MAG: GNAT family N-acetyltransferase [Citrobacter telavivensis]